MTGSWDSGFTALPSSWASAIERRSLGTRRDVPLLLPGLDVSCLSSVHEGVPIALIETIAAGVPIVATDCGAVRNIVDDGEQGYLVPVGDVEPLRRPVAPARGGRGPSGSARQGGAGPGRNASSISSGRRVPMRTS